MDKKAAFKRIEAALTKPGEPTDAEAREVGVAGLWLLWYFCDSIERVAVALEKANENNKGA